MSLLADIQTKLYRAKILDKNETQAIYLLAEVCLVATKATLLELERIGDQLERVADNIETFRRTVQQK